MLQNIENTLSNLLSPDIGKLILRLSVGSLMLFHGIHKIIDGIGGVKHLVNKASLPEFISYGVYAGEIIFPLFIILGIYTRLSSLFFAINMSFAIYLAYGDSLFSLGKMGGLAIELPLLFLCAAITIMFIGSGKYSVK